MAKLLWQNVSRRYRRVVRQQHVSGQTYGSGISLLFDFQRCGICRSACFLNIYSYLCRPKILGLEHKFKIYNHLCQQFNN